MSGCGDRSALPSADQAGGLAPARVSPSSWYLLFGDFVRLDPSGATPVELGLEGLHAAMEGGRDEGDAS